MPSSKILTIKILDTKLCDREKIITRCQPYDVSQIEIQNSERGSDQERQRKLEIVPASINKVLQVHMNFVDYGAALLRVIL